MGKCLITVAKEELVDYYLNQNHTFTETIKHFNLTGHRFYKLMHEYGIVKPSVKELESRVTCDDIMDYYVNQNHGFMGTVNYFNTTADVLRDYLTKHKIKKAEIQYHKIQQLRDKAFSIDPNILYQYYVVENHSQKDTCEHFDIRLCDLHRVLPFRKFRQKSQPKYPNMTLSEAIGKISKSDLEAIYIVKNLSKAETAEYFQVCPVNIDKLIKFYNLRKPLSKVWELTRRSKLNNSGVLGNPQIFANYSDEFKKLYYDKEASLKFLNVKPRYKARDLAQKFNCKPINIFGWVKRLGLRQYIANEKSIYEKELTDILLAINPDMIIKRNYRKLLANNQEVDIYLPEYNIALEFNGIYWHSDAVISDKNYHINKAKLAEQKNVRLIHIYEYEWLDNVTKDKILSILNIALKKISNKIYARNCIIKEISNKEAKPFNEANHLQGHRNAQVTYGLFYQDKLVQLMSFSKTKYNRNLKGDNDWEIIRGCPGSNNIVVGGVSKLFKHFIKEHNPDKIFSYCDFNKFDGKGYEAIGMKFIGYTGPDKKYIIRDRVMNRNPSKYKEYKDQIDYTIYGAGSKKYIWEKNNLDYFR